MNNDLKFSSIHCLKLGAVCVHHSQKLTVMPKKSLSFPPWGEVVVVVLYTVSSSVLENNNIAI